MRTLLVTVVVVIISVTLEVALTYYQATRGKLPFKIQLFPNLGG